MQSTSPSPPLSRGPGRPREFEIDEALDKAIVVFCERGYQATSIGDLANAMELTPGSIYKAFKDKKSIFLSAFDRNITIRKENLALTIAGGETGRDRIRLALAFYAESSHGVEGLRGCLVVGSTTELAIIDKGVAQRVSEELNRNEALLFRLIEEGRMDGSIPRRIDSKATARFMLCLLQGMRVVGKIGRTQEEMAAVVAVAMRALS